MAVVIVAVAVVMFYPVEIIANLVSASVQATILFIVLSIFTWMFPKDRSKKPRMRTGRKGSVWISSFMNSLVLCITAIVLFLMLLFVPQSITPLVTQYMIEMGKVNGIPILAIAMSAALISIIQLLNSAQQRQSKG